MTYFKELTITTTQTRKAYIAVKGYKGVDEIEQETQNVLQVLANPELALVDFKLINKEINVDATDVLEIKELPNDIILVDEVLEPLGFKPKPLSFMEAFKTLEDKGFGYITNGVKVVALNDGLEIYYTKRFEDNPDKCQLSNEDLKDEWFYFQTRRLLHIWLE